MIDKTFSLPETEAHRWNEFGEFEGLPNLDVEKAAVCVALCPSFATAIDVGAHIGAVSAYLARRFSRVVAFEAVPMTFDLLRQNTAGLRNVEVHNVAVGNGPGEVFFTHYRTHGQLSHVSTGADEGPKTERIGPVPTQSIDSMNLLDVSFMKIDVEGYEMAVVEGAAGTIRRCRPLILIEQGGNEEKYFGRPRNEASAALEAMGMHQHPGAPSMKHDRLYSF